jgi:hypothetical protein
MPDSGPGFTAEWQDRMMTGRTWVDGTGLFRIYGPTGMQEFVADLAVLHDLKDFCERVLSADAARMMATEDPDA